MELVLPLFDNEINSGRCSKISRIRRAEKKNREALTMKHKNFGGP